jgi:hypothetical protein
MGELTTRDKGKRQIKTTEKDNKGDRGDVEECLRCS